MADNQLSIPVVTTRRLSGALSPFPSKLMTWEAQGGTGLVFTYGGFGTSSTGTVSLRAFATTNLVTSMRRLAFVSSSIAGSSAGTRHAINQFWRGSSVTDPTGGFLYVARFNIDTTAASMRWFVGFTDSTSVIANVNPSTLLNILGFGIDSGQTTVRFFNNDGAGAATATDLGASFPATNISVVYEARILCATNGTVIRYSLERLDAPFSFVEGSVSADIPANTVAMNPQIWVNNGPTAAAVAINIVSQFVETRY